MSTFPNLSAYEAGNGTDRLAARRTPATSATDKTLFGPLFIQQLVAAARPQLEELIREVLAENGTLLNGNLVR